MYEIFDPTAVLLAGGAGALERFWKIDEEKIKLIGGGAPFSELSLQNGEDGLTRLKEILPHSYFHLTLLGAGQYYPCMARPNSCRPEDSPGRNPDPDIDGSIKRGRALSSGQLDALIEQFKLICQTVHPEGENLNAFGHDIRNLLILACTEVEAQWKNVLTRPCGRILERCRFWDSRGESGMIHQDSGRIGDRGQCRQRWMRTIGSTRLRCFAPACLGADGRPRTTAASSRRFISSPSRTFAGARCRSASVIGTACGSASIG